MKLVSFVIFSRHMPRAPFPIHVHVSFHSARILFTSPSLSFFHTSIYYASLRVIDALMCKIRVFRSQSSQVQTNQYREFFFFIIPFYYLLIALSFPQSHSR
jgi:hypothetical protein